MPKRLTRKQEKLARERVKDPNATLSELAVKAGYSSPQHVKTAIDKPHIQARVKDLMDSSPKLQIPSLLKKLEEGLEATETKFFQEKGIVTDERECVDHGTRHRYLETALGLHGLKEQVSAQAAPTNLILNIFQAIDDARRKGIVPPRPPIQAEVEKPPLE